MAPAVTTSKLRKQINEILKDADLNNLSARKVRSQLETFFKADLSDRKQEVDDLLMTIIEENEKSEDSAINSPASEDEMPQAKKRKAVVKAKPKNIKKSTKVEKVRNDDSDDDSNDLKINLDANSEDGDDKVKTDNDDNSELDDEALARQLQNEERGSRRRAASKNVPCPKEKKRKIKIKDPNAKKKENSYTRKCVLSEDLAEVMGAPEMERHNVVKKIWEIARERDLFDPKNKRFILCDDQLKKIFGIKRLLMFGMMKRLKRHIHNTSKNPEDE